jgi:hypothetical protein
MGVADRDWRSTRRIDDGVFISVAGQYCPHATRRRSRNPPIQIEHLLRTTGLRTALIAVVRMPDQCE